MAPDYENISTLRTRDYLVQQNALKAESATGVYGILQEETSTVSYVRAIVFRLREHSEGGLSNRMEEDQFADYAAKGVKYAKPRK